MIKRDKCQAYVKDGWVIEGYPEPLKEEECEQISQAMKDLESLRYHTFAHALHNLEKRTDQKREDIEQVWYDGGNGWVMCSVRFKTGADWYESDEFLAALILDWAKANKKLVEWQERRFE